jgi:predicted site-specific integrase-resolvase
MKDTMTTQEAAEFLGVHPVTLRKWRKKSEFIGCCAITGIAMSDDCQGLTWWHQHPKKIVYNTSSVQRLKRILNRRKVK